ncbi:MAG: substrate-binding periplasmic protein [Aestuariibacter sp.]
MRSRLQVIILICHLLLLSKSGVMASELLFVAEELPPIHFKNTQQHPDGFLVEVTKAVLAKTDFKAAFEILPQARAFESTIEQPNVFMISLLRSADRETQFQWVGEVYQTKAFLLGLAGREDIQLTELADAKQHIVGTIRGYFSESYLRQQGFSDKYNLGLAVRYDHLWGMLFKGHVDLVLTNTLSQQREITKAGYDPEQVVHYLALPELTRELYIATGLQTPMTTVKALSIALQQVKAEGTYTHLEKKWRLTH